MKILLRISPLLLAIPVGVLSAEIILRAKEIMYWRVR